MKRLAFFLTLMLLSELALAENFNVIVDIPKSYSTLAPGEEIIASIKLLNLGATRREDVTLECWVEDAEGREILKKTETVAVETQANFVRWFDLPKDIKPGTYKFYAKITYVDGKFAIGEHSFQVVEKEPISKIYYAAIAVGSLVAIIVFLSRSKPLIERIEIRLKVRKIVRERMKKL